MATEKAKSSSYVNQEVDLDELMDVRGGCLSDAFSISVISFCSHFSFLPQDPELEKLHADRIAALKVCKFLFSLALAIIFQMVEFFSIKIRKKLRSGKN